MTRVGRCSRSMSQAVVADLPVPVAPSSTTSFSPPRMRRSSSLDRRRLVAGRLEVGDDLELAGRRDDVGRTRMTPRYEAPPTIRGPMTGRADGRPICPADTRGRAGSRGCAAGHRCRSRTLGRTSGRRSATHRSRSFCQAGRRIHGLTLGALRADLARHRLPVGCHLRRSGTNFALFSEVAETRRAVPVRRRRHRDARRAARGRRLRLARLPARRRAGPALRLPRARPERPGQRPALQPEQAAARPVRQGDRRHHRVGRVAVRLPLGRRGLPSTTTTRPRTCPSASSSTRSSTGATTARRSARTPTRWSTRRTSRA